MFIILRRPLAQNFLVSEIDDILNTRNEITKLSKTENDTQLYIFKIELPTKRPTSVVRLSQVLKGDYRSKLLINSLILPVYYWNIFKSIILIRINLKCWAFEMLFPVKNKPNFVALRSPRLALVEMMFGATSSARFWITTFQQNELLSS